jgi:hypothetical protein
MHAIKEQVELFVDIGVRTQNLLLVVFYLTDTNIQITTADSQKE